MTPVISAQIGIPTYSPANYAELVYWLDLLVKEKRGPRAIRYASRGGNPGAGGAWLQRAAV